jgi:hypothetical protein
MKRQAVRWIAGMIVLAALAGTGRAQEAAPPPDPAFEAAKAAFESMPLENRTLIQRSLAWAVPFNGAALGSFGKLTYNAIKAFEKKAALEMDGMLTSEELATLVSEAEAAQKAVRFKLVEDKKSGVKIGLPLKLLTEQESTSLGAKWSNADGSIAVETAKGSGTADDLPAAFERYLALPGRKVTYKLLRPDFFVVTGENGPNSFYVRYAANPEAMRGFTFRYPTAKQKLMDRYVIAAANSFQPFPGANAEPDTSGGSASPPAVPARRLLSAIMMSGGALLVPEPLIAGCKTLDSGGQALTPAPAAAGLVTLAGISGDSGVKNRTEAPQNDEAVVVLSATTDGSPALAPGRLIVSGSVVQVEASLQPGASGAAVIDRRGGLVGLVTGDPSTVKPIAGITPVARYSLAVTTGGTEAPGATLSTGALAKKFGKAVLPLNCAF